MLTVIIVLIVVGLLLMIMEITVIPGTGFAGIIGFVIMVTAIWLAYTKQGVTTGNIVLAATLTINIVGIILALRSKTWKNAMLKTVNKGKVNTINKGELKVGDTGTTISRCAPMGKAEFNNVFYEVSTLSEFIDQETQIKIIKISRNKIYIKTIK